MDRRTFEMNFHVHERLKMDFFKTMQQRVRRELGVPVDQFAAQGESGGSR
jgi:hypothetical protein